MEAVTPRFPLHDSHAARVPRGLDPQRAWRWCLLVTLRDALRARRRQREISMPNMERMFCRRWARVAGRCAPAVGGRRYHTWARRGRELLRSDRLGHVRLRPGVTRLGQS